MFSGDTTETEPDVVVDPSDVSDEPVSEDVKAATEHLLQAQEKLHSALILVEDIIGEFAGLSKDDAVIETEPIQTHLNTVRGAIAAAESGANQQQQRFITGLRHITTALEATVPLLDQFDQGVTAYGEWEDAVSAGDSDSITRTVGSFTDSTNKAFDRLGEVKTPFNSVRSAVYAETESITEGRINRFLAEIDGVVSVLTVVRDRMGTFSEGVKAVVRAREQLAADDFEQSIVVLEEATELFDSAFTSFVEAEELVLNQYKPDIQAFQCASNAAKGASEAYGQAMAASVAENETDVTANVMAAQQSLDGCSYSLTDSVFDPFRERLL